MLWGPRGEGQGAPGHTARTALQAHRAGLLSPAVCTRGPVCVHVHGCVCEPECVRVRAPGGVCRSAPGCVHVCVVPGCVCTGMHLGVCVCAHGHAHSHTWLCVQYWDRQQCTPERFHVRVDMRGMLVLTCVQVGPPPGVCSG